MSDYSQTVDFSVKDSEAFGAAAKTIKGTELDVEWDAISTALATKLEYDGGVWTPVWSGFSGITPSNGAVDLRWQIFRDGTNDLVMLTTVDGKAVTGNAGSGVGLSLSNLPKRIWPTGAQNASRMSSIFVLISDGVNTQGSLIVQADGQVFFAGMTSDGTWDATPGTASTLTRGVPAGWMTMYALTTQAP